MPNSSEKSPKKTTRAKSPAKPRAKAKTPDTSNSTAVALAEPTTSVAVAERMPTREQIAARARELYVKSGYREGHDLEFWLEAERQLRSEG